MSEINETPSTYQIRQELIDLVTRDLLGPANGPEEIVVEKQVYDRYILGLIAPKGQSVISNEDGQLENDPSAISDIDSTPDDQKSDVVSLRPTSIGLTFSMSESATSFCFHAEWGTYHQTRAEIEDEDEHQQSKRAWQRVPHVFDSDEIPLKKGAIGKIYPDNDVDVYFQGMIRKQGKIWIVTLFLVNGQPDPKGKAKSAYWLFQPEIRVFAPDHSAVFCGKLQLHPENEDEEDKSMRMLYRKNVEFAVGHGTAVHAELAEDLFDKAIEIRTVSAPIYQLSAVKRPDKTIYPELDHLVLDMKVLSGLDGDAFSQALEPLIAAYQGWIASLEEQFENPTPDLRPYMQQAAVSISNCKRNLDRIQTGIDILAKNPDAAKAFRFCNQAMYKQRMHTLFTEGLKKDPTVELINYDEPDKHSWYPFQLAFILLNIPSLTNPGLDERSNPTQAIADVLWFPTGGGKTEAYLGLTAYTLAMRRLQGKIGDYDGSAGVAVLMRYTLRMLTLQQFERAAALICACEEIRREDPLTWGSEPFRIGLWVGMKSTPNSTEQSAAFVRNLKGKGGSYSPNGSPHQLSHCPWCGEEIDPGQDIIVETYKDGHCRTLVYCHNRQCLFSQKNSPGEGLPVIVVDEEIYRRLPSLLISTVDKFAQMPWKGESEAIFGRVNGYCERHGYTTPSIEDASSHPAVPGRHLDAVKTKNISRLRPPDLIIQDELHLINGPLGTMVGLYETVVDALCNWEYNGKTIRPKVIASSATIRKAPKQVHNLYLRRANIFPPSGLEEGDNFFSYKVTADEENPGRIYMAICAPGVRQKAVMLRTYITTLAAGQFLYNKYRDAADPYMTLVGYFNAIRDLGGMRRALEDSAVSRLGRMSERGLANRRMTINDIRELTSRMSAAEIPAVLDRLSVPYAPYVNKKRSSKDSEEEFLKKHIDTVLCTNMISVGVDVPRLGLMVVDSQPKYTSEYIQATSRVGRRFPGIVFMVYNWSRPRDMSHYERFEHYHATLYENVEALTVTPFTPRALDRGLSGVLVSLMRLNGFDLNENRDANKMNQNDPAVKEIVDVISKRAALVMQDSEVEKDVRSELQSRLDHWSNRIDHYKNSGSILGYKSDRKKPPAIALLHDPADLQQDKFDCPTSMRGVEAMSNVILHKPGEMDITEG